MSTGKYHCTDNKLLDYCLFFANLLPVAGTSKYETNGRPGSMVAVAQRESIRFVIEQLRVQIPPVTPTSSTRPIALTIDRAKSDTRGKPHADPKTHYRLASQKRQAMNVLGTVQHFC